MFQTGFYTFHRDIILFVWGRIKFLGLATRSHGQPEPKLSQELPPQTLEGMPQELNIFFKEQVGWVEKERVV